MRICEHSAKNAMDIDDFNDDSKRTRERVWKWITNVIVVPLASRI